MQRPVAETQVTAPSVGWCAAYGAEWRSNRKQSAPLHMCPHRKVRINVNSEVTGCFTWCNRGRANRQTKSGKSLLTSGCSEPHELSLVAIKNVMRVHAGAILSQKQHFFSRKYETSKSREYLQFCGVMSCLRLC